MHDRREVTGKVFLLAGLVAATAASATDPRRPYEMEWAGRTADDRPPLCALTTGKGWRISGSNSEATFTRATARLLFGDGVARLRYRALGGEEKPRVFVRPPSPVLVTNDFDAVSCWVFGNNVFGRDPSTPSVTIDLQFIDREGKRFAVNLGHVHHKGWYKFHGRVPRSLSARAVAGCKFDGFCVHGGWNGDFRELDFNSLAVFKEEFKPLAFKERPKRGAVIFPLASQGINTGEGRLPFPVSADTVLPPATFGELDPSLEFRLPDGDAARWDDLAFRIDGGEWISLAKGGGVFPDGAADVAKVRFSRRGNSLIADVEVSEEAESVAEIRFGNLAGHPVDAVRTVFPFYTYREKERDARPAVIGWNTSRGPFFVAATADWTQSNASSLFAVSNSAAMNGGSHYLLRTDGRRNPCYDRFIWSFGTNVHSVLPKIPNPPSPWKHLTGSHLWRQYGVVDREKDLSYWRALKRRGISKVIVTDHETAWRRNEEQSYAFRTRTEPSRGGDEAQERYAREMIDHLGYVYGPYNNYIDLATVNEYWNEDNIIRRDWLHECSLQPAWRRCWRAKPAWAVSMCEKIAQEVQRKFHFNCGYCDVHTCMRPWDATDYDARVPGAGTFTAGFYAYGEIMLLQKRIWGGPVYSEGPAHWFYSGLTDGNYAQDREYDLAVGPWLVDFDLRRMHPLECNFGMGMIDAHFYATPGTAPADRSVALDRFFAATVAFGHPGYLLPERHAAQRRYADVKVGEEEFRSYYLIQAIASKYTVSDVRTIKYGCADGRLLSTEEAIMSNECDKMQVLSSYSDGTVTAANGSTDAWFSFGLAGMEVKLPPNGLFAISGDRKACAWIGEHEGRRAEFAISPDYVYLNGRGAFARLPGGATDGICVRRPLDGKAEEVIPFGAKRIELPYVADRIEALDETGGVIETVVPQVKKGRTLLEPQPRVVSYRVTRKASFPGISFADCLEAILK